MEKNINFIERRSKNGERYYNLGWQHLILGRSQTKCQQEGWGVCEGQEKTETMSGRPGSIWRLIWKCMKSMEAKPATVSLKKKPWLGAVSSQTFNPRMVLSCSRKAILLRQCANEHGKPWEWDRDIHIWHLAVSTAGKRELYGLFSKWSGIIGDPYRKSNFWSPSLSY
jgi:hypothetical protein